MGHMRICNEEDEELINKIEKEIEQEARNNIKT